VKVALKLDINQIYD